MPSFISIILQSIFPALAVGTTLILGIYGIQKIQNFLNQTSNFFAQQQALLQALIENAQKKLSLTRMDHYLTQIQTKNLTDSTWQNLKNKFYFGYQLIRYSLMHLSPVLAEALIDRKGMHNILLALACLIMIAALLAAGLNPYTIGICLGALAAVGLIYSIYVTYQYIQNTGVTIEHVNTLKNRILGRPLADRSALEIYKQSLSAQLSDAYCLESIKETHPDIAELFASPSDDPLRKTKILTALQEAASTDATCERILEIMLKQPETFLSFSIESPTFEQLKTAHSTLMNGKLPKGQSLEDLYAQHQKRLLQTLMTIWAAKDPESYQEHIDYWERFGKDMREHAENADDPWMQEAKIVFEKPITEISIDPIDWYDRFFFSLEQAVSSGEEIPQILKDKLSEWQELRSNASIIQIQERSAFLIERIEASIHEATSPLITPAPENALKILKHRYWMLENQDQKSNDSYQDALYTSSLIAQTLNWSRALKSETQALSEEINQVIQDDPSHVIRNLLEEIQNLSLESSAHQNPNSELSENIQALAHNQIQQQNLLIEQRSLMFSMINGLKSLAHSDGKMRRLFLMQKESFGILISTVKDLLKNTLLTFDQGFTIQNIQENLDLFFNGNMDEASYKKQFIAHEKSKPEWRIFNEFHPAAIGVATLLSLCSGGIVTLGILYYWHQKNKKLLSNAESYAKNCISFQEEAKPHYEKIKDLTQSFKQKVDSIFQEQEVIHVQAMAVVDDKEEFKNPSTALVEKASAHLWNRLISDDAQFLLSQGSAITKGSVQALPQLFQAQNDALELQEAIKKLQKCMIKYHITSKHVVVGMQTIQASQEAITPIVALTSCALVGPMSSTEKSITTENKAKLISYPEEINVKPLVE